MLVPLRHPTLLALLAFAARCALGADVDATAVPPWELIDGSPVAPNTWVWYSGCVRSGQYERPREIGTEPSHTYSGLPAATCYFQVSVRDVSGNESVPSNEASYDAVLDQIIPPTPSSAPTGDVSFVLNAPPAFSRAFDFRSSAACSTDPAGSVAVLATAYTAALGYGWEGAVPEKRDRDCALPAALAGQNQLVTGSSSPSEVVFRVDLPAPGRYRIRIAAGDATTANRAFWEVRDGTTVVLSRAEVETLPGRFVDASGVTRTTTTWLTANVPVERAFVTKIVRFVLKRPSQRSAVVATFSLEVAP